WRFQAGRSSKSVWTWWSPWRVAGSSWRDDHSAHGVVQQEACQSRHPSATRDLRICLREDLRKPFRLREVDLHEERSPRPVARNEVLFAVARDVHWSPPEEIEMTMNRLCIISTVALGLSGACGADGGGKGRAELDAGAPAVFRGTGSPPFPPPPPRRAATTSTATPSARPTGAPTCFTASIGLRSNGRPVARTFRS